MSRNVRALLLAMALVTLVAGPVAAQTTGMVAGSVKDAQGGVIPSATVTLTSETRGTKVQPVYTNTNGDYVFVNIAPDTYTVTVTMNGFKNSTRGGIAVSPGDRVAVPTIVIEVGAQQETVTVTAEAALIQAQSGERSYAVGTEGVANLPIVSRSFTQLATLAPGVTVDGNNTPTRIGGGGSTNIMMDGVSSNDTGSNRPLLQMNVESIAEVKVLTSGYQAEFGRSSGVQVTAVTKSGSNRFHGSLYDVERNSKWNANSKTNILNGNPKTRSKARDMGYSIGGPVGKPGGSNKLFFFYSQEFSPRTGGNDVQRFRLPTALERKGDFSQSLDNNGNLFNLIKNPFVNGACTASDHTACFQDGGVLGRIPQAQLYQTGMNILNMWPLPNLDSVAGTNYNYQLTRPVENVLSYQPAIRVDYQATSSLRVNVRTSFWKQQAHQFNGSLPGFNDTRMQNAPVSNTSASVNWTITPTMFLEGTWGRAQNQLAGCAQAQSDTGPVFCTAAVPVDDSSALANVGLQSLPFLFPDATVLNPGYYAVKALNQIAPPFWDGSRMAKVPTFQWGGRVPGGGTAPPGIGFPGWLNINTTNDVSISLTKLKGRHTFKGGFYNTHSFKAEQTSNNAFGTINFGNDTNNPLDTGFGFSNAALGIFSSYLQATKYAETSSIYNNTEFYLQDNWKVNARLTLDYGMRFVHQQAQYDKFAQASNFLPDKWSIGAAPAIYVPGCANGAATCSTKQAKNPLTGQLLGPNTAAAIGTLVPNTGDPLNGLFLPGEDGLPRATFVAPFLGYAPRFGAAYDLTGDQNIVLRGGVGLFYDRPSSTTFSGGVNNPPTSAAVTSRYTQLQTLGSGLSTQGVPSINGFAYDSKLPSSTQWNTGIQMGLPGAIALDVSYVGQHSWNQYVGTNINTIDLGTAFLPSSIDTTTAGGTTVLNAELLRAIRGYNNITMQLQYGFRTYHSIQVSFNRRFRNGLSFGFNDTMSLYDHQQVGLRLQHNPDGTYVVRDDMAQANDLFGDNHPQTHFMKANFIWDLPDVKSDNTTLRAVGWIVNDWQLSGIWSANTAGLYAIGFSYQNGGSNQNLTGSPDVGARVRLVGDTGRGCSSNIYQQFNTTAFQGPLVGSVGLDSPGAYMHGCFSSTLDLAIARNIRLGGGRQIQLRADMFNAPNSAIITGRQATMNLNSPNDPITITNPVYDANGNVVRGTPANAGFGFANGFQTPRNVQLQIRFSF